MEETTTDNQRLRIALRVTGAALWILVIVAGFYTWKSRSGRDDALPEGTYRPNRGTQPFPNVRAFLPYDLPDFSLQECRGRTIRKSDLLGRPWVVCFTFTHCTGQCRRIDSQMSELQSQLAGTDARLVTISVDPDRDTPEVLKRHADRLRADPDQWWFLTGKRDDVYRLIVDGFRLSVARRKGENRTKGNEVSHSHSVLHVDARGRVVGKYLGTSDTDMAKLRRRLLRDFRSRKRPQRASGRRAAGDDTPDRSEIKPVPVLPVKAPRPKASRDHRFPGEVCKTGRGGTNG